MKVMVLKNFSTINRTFVEGQEIDLPKGVDWLKVKLVKRITKKKVVKNE